MCIKVNQNYKGKRKLGRTCQRWEDNNTSCPYKSSEPTLSLLTFEVMHIYVCIIIIMKAIFILMGFDIIHINQYVSFSDCDIIYLHRCALFVDLQTAVNLFCGPSPYQILYP